MQTRWIWQWKGSVRQALMEKKIKWEKIMMLNMSACNYKPAVSMSFICKQIRLPPLFPTVKGSICVIATLEKKWMSYLRFFSSCSGDLFATAIIPLPRTWAARLSCLWHSHTTESQQLLLRAGRAAQGQPCPRPGDSDSCVTSPLCSPLCHRVGDRVVLLCVATKRSFPCITAFRRGVFYCYSTSCKVFLF